MSDHDIPDGDHDRRLVEEVRARGHENVTAEHASTFEFTTDDWLTPAGDCILAVEADRTPDEFDPAFREACRDADATITATIVVGVDGAAEEKVVAENDDPAEGGGDTYKQTVTGRGHPEMTLTDDRSMVGRTSDYVDDRTVLVDADAAAVDLDRELVAALADGAPATLRLEVKR